MAWGRKHGGQVAGKGKAALRQAGTFEVHPGDCECRKCRRAEIARARRAEPRYGQQAGTTRKGYANGGGAAPSGQEN